MYSLKALLTKTPVQISGAIIAIVNACIGADWITLSGKGVAAVDTILVMGLGLFVVSTTTNNAKLNELQDSSPRDRTFPFEDHRSLLDAMHAMQEPAATIVVRTIDEAVVDGKRLGRHLEHDVRSLLFPAPRAATLKTVAWAHHGAVLDQGQLGSCTGNAAVDCLMSAPLWTSGRRLTEADAVRAYELATALDNVPGAYPPADTGSTGLAAAKAAKHLGWISSYTHAFGIDHALAALMNGPVMFGTDWHAGMDLPAPDGRVTIAGPVRGGHEYAGIGYDVTTGLITCLNSWGRGWGVKGTFKIHRDAMARLLAAGGDVTQLVA